jgi:TonB-dependent starch-binding outer membrane protein SusC
MRSKSNITILLLGGLLLAAGWMPLFAQNAPPLTVTGTVFSTSDNTPLAGANVQVKGSKNLVSTDDRGRFVVQARTGDVLLITAIGYQTTKVTVGSTADIRIGMPQDYGHMNDVVVIGYGQMKKTDLSSSQTTVTAADISKTVNTTLDEALQGRAAGVYVSSPSGQPGAGANVIIRGISSLTQNTQPLYVIDGVQIVPAQFADDPNNHPTGFANALSGINPDDIETMNVLEGPAATAIFGSSGANGVIMITTKHGKAGETKISASTLWTIQEKPKEIPVMNLQEYAKFRNEVAAAGGTASDPSFTDPSALGAGTDWQSALYRKTLLEKHTLAISGGNDRTTFYISGEYFNQNGIAPGSGFTRSSTRINLDNKIRPWLKIGVNLNPSYTVEKVSTTNAGIVSLAIQQNPSIPVKNPDGSWGGPTTSQYQFSNPVALSYINSDYNKSLGVLGGGYADITFLKGLVFHTEANTNLNYLNNYIFHPSYDFNGLINPTTVAYVNTINSYWWNLHMRLQYETRIGLHSITAMAGHEAISGGGGQLNGTRQNFVTNSVTDLSGGDQSTSIANSSRYDYASESYFGRVNYVYNERYILFGSLRADGSSNFGPLKRWGYFPAASAAWRISQESFMRNISAINDLKLRVEYGSSGNSGASGYYAQLQTVPTPWGTGFLSQNFANPYLHWETDRTINIGFDLHMYNNRVELIGDVYKKFTSNLLTVNPYAFYNGGDIAYSAGYISWPTTNVGSMWNKGFTVTLNTVNVDSKQFTWKTGFNISVDRNQVTKLLTPINTAYNSSQVEFLTEVGHPVGMITGYIAQGLFKNYADITSHAVQTSNGVMTVSPQGTWAGDVKFKDLNGDGQINASDRTIIGNPWPKFTFGFNNSFSYKRFDLNVFIIGSIGNDILNYERYQNSIPLDGGTYGNYYKSVAGFAQPSSYNITDSSTVTLTNPGGQISRVAPGDPNGNNRMSQWYVENGSYVRIKNVALSYNFPAHLLGKSFVRGLNVGVNVQNLLTITKYTGYDPEIGMVNYSGVNMVGVDTGRYPNVRMYSFHLLADF